MIKAITTITIPIRGRDWTFKLLQDRIFDKLHNKEDSESNTAMTVPERYEVHFKKSDLMFRDIKHELGHVYSFMSGTKSVDTSPDDIEELFCDIIADFGSEITMLSERILENFQSINRS